MTSGWNATRKTIAGALAAAVVATAAPAPLAAQDDEARLRRIEAELRALQRTVFPGGDGRYFAPEVDTSQPRAQPQPGVPSSGTLTDVLGRLDAIEAQLARLTARSEENANELTQLETRVTEAMSAARAAPSGVIEVPSLAQTPAGTSSSTPAPAPAAATRAPSPERVAAVQAIAKPVTDDPGDDEYTYGFRLWDAGFFSEAQQQLALFLQRYPRHARTSFGKNLLGRAYLDNGQPREAATHFFDNYQADKESARAPDSLLYLSEAMIAINDTNRACIALAEFSETYPAIASGRLKEQYDRTRSKVTCS